MQTLKQRKVLREATRTEAAGAREEARPAQHPAPLDALPSRVRAKFIEMLAAITGRPLK